MQYRIITLGNIGEEQEEVEYEPFPTSVPEETPVPITVPDSEPVPA